MTRTERITADQDSDKYLQTFPASLLALNTEPTMDSGIYILGIIACALLISRGVAQYNAWKYSGRNANLILASKIAGAILGLSGGVFGGLTSGTLLEMSNPEGAFIRTSQEALWGGLFGLVLGGLVGVSGKIREGAIIGTISGGIGGALGGALLAISPGTTSIWIVVMAATGAIGGAAVGATVGITVGKISQLIFRMIWGPDDF